jgi:transposase
MGALLSAKERLKLIKTHKKESKQRYADRIKTILLLDSNWPIIKITEALLLDENTIRNYKERYESGGLEGLCSDAYQGRPCSLNEKELVRLEKELRANIYLTTKEVIIFVKETFGIEYSQGGMANLLHRIGFSYKKPDIVPGKADAEKQEDFLQAYRELQRTKGNKNKVYFVDGVHPQHNSMPGYGWLPRGERTKLKSNTGRERLNLNGALDASTLEVIADQYERLNAESTIDFFKTIEVKNLKADKIYLILDNAGYYKGEKIREYLKNSKIELIFLPPYSPNLNLIERLWKFFKKTVLYNKYYPTFKEFKIASLNFFEKDNLDRYRQELRSLISDNFQIVSA